MLGVKFCKPAEKMGLGWPFTSVRPIERAMGKSLLLATAPNASVLFTVNLKAFATASLLMPSDWFFMRKASPKAQSPMGVVMPPMLNVLF